MRRSLLFFFVFSVKKKQQTRGMTTGKDARALGLQGELVLYGHNLQYFESGPSRSGKKLIVLGGLSDGLLACPYVPALAHEAAALGWSTVQPVLRSSYAQFGFRSLDTDCEDLTVLCDELRRRGSLTEIAVLGHSTGAQICAHFVRTCPPPELCKVILQAGVSDRETDDEKLAAERKHFLDTYTNDPEAFLPSDAYWAPITQQRFRDLFGKNGADDYFSSDLSDDALADRFRNFRQKNIATLIAYSEHDEHAPPSVDKEALVARLATHMGPRATPVIVPDGDHALTQPKPQAFFLDKVRHFLQE